MWKGCIFMMMMANLCATEMYHFLIDGSKASKVRCADQDGSLKVVLFCTDSDIFFISDSCQHVFYFCHFI